MGEQLREIVASELERIGDERLELVTITAVDVDGSLETADVFYSAMSADEDGRSEEVAEALDEQRWKVQQLINREVQMRRTPQIRFRPDTVLSSALRIEEILRDLGEQDSGEQDGGEQDSGDGTGDDVDAPGSGDEQTPE
ncbi:MAG: ribosome-binding factor A [Actinomycetota bacterium]|nr:ribosome-binding factor A [Actinomycetota bacterium]